MPRKSKYQKLYDYIIECGLEPEAVKLRNGTYKVTVGKIDSKGLYHRVAGFTYYSQAIGKCELAVDMFIRASIHWLKQGGYNPKIKTFI